MNEVNRMVPPNIGLVREELTTDRDIRKKWVVELAVYLTANEHDSPWSLEDNVKRVLEALELVGDREDES